VRRREFIAGLAGTAAWPLAAHGQQTEQVRRVGVLMSVVQEDPSGAVEATALRQGLMELGWIEGRNIEIEFRWPGGDIERAQTFARELVLRRPDVLVGRSTPATTALKREAPNTPIIFVGVIEPQAFVQSLARPGGNITGFTNVEPSFGGKWLQVLKEIDPRISRVAVIYNPQTAPYAALFLRSIQLAAPTFSVETIASPVHDDGDIETALTMIARRPSGGLISIPDAFVIQHRELVIGLAARSHLPAVYPIPIFVREGGLLSYGIDSPDMFRRAASYVDRVLRGAKPADLPVQLPVKFAVAVNVTTAKALALTVPSSILLRADEVIE
jgi:putative tryptophan/tyrosine transport system substrate-binding protein